MGESMNQDVIEAVKSKLAGAEDNLYRTKMGFRHLSQAAMNEDYGQSGRTCKSILADAEAEVDRWKKALASI